NALRALLAAGGISLVEVGRDKYGGRVLAGLLTREGRDVAGLMLASGQARPYAGGRRAPWCASLSARR
ncbi:MAG TPA: hypothetical protein PK812_11000, partial [Beijerinckiaceae bacterium]|nr:hypothetical protein [Beijerinckiaceae bacterium]